MGWATPAPERYWDMQPNNATVVKPMAFDVYNPLAWTVGNSIETTQNLVGSQPSPRYTIEYLGTDALSPVNEIDLSAGRYVFRITAIGTGVDQITTHVAQSTFRIPLF